MRLTLQELTRNEVVYGHGIVSQTRPFEPSVAVESDSDLVS